MSFFSFLAAAAVAASSPSAPASDIVIKGNSQDTITTFVQDMTDTNRTDQIARWQNVICPGIVDLDNDQAEFLNARIGNTASMVGLKPAKPGCHPNILVIFTQDAKKLATGYAKLFPNALSGDGRNRLQQFSASDRPIRWISQTDLLAYDGSPFTPGSPGQVPTGRLANSRITPSTRAIMSLMLIIVDANRLEHVALGPLGDYLAMVALGHPRLDAPTHPQSILSMFDAAPTEHPGLTDYDRSYLTGLYAASGEQSGKAQASTIRHSMSKADGTPSGH